MWRKISLPGVLVLLVSAASLALAQAPLNWETSLENARRQAAASNRLVLVHFWGAYCPACHKMDQEVFSSPAVQAAIQANYVAVRLNVEHNRPIAQQCGVASLPTDVILTPDGRLIDRQPGFTDAYQFVARLQQIALNTRRAYAATPPAQPTGPLPTTPQTPTAVNTAAATPGPAPAGVWPAQPQPTGPAATPGVVMSNPPVVASTAAPPATNPPVAGQGPMDFGPAPPMTQGAPAMSLAQAPPNWQTPAGSPPVPDALGGASAPPAASTVLGPPTPVGPAVAEQPTVAPAPQDPAACPFALEGYCPVELVENKAWRLGDARWGANHRGRIYLFAGPGQQERFMKDPDRYSPVAAGIDVVLAVNKGVTVGGQRRFGVFFRDRVFLFAGEDSLEMFSAEPGRYYDEVVRFEQASRPSGPVQR